MKRRRVDVNLTELDQLLDQARRNSIERARLQENQNGTPHVG